jgi:ATP-dependent DNA ligase
MKPLLALSKVVTPQQVPLPTLASIKSDGIRGCAVDGQIWSRNEKLIPNRFIQSELKGLHGIEGELLLRDETKDFNDQQSAFMSVGGQPDFVFKVFDYWDSSFSFSLRRDSAHRYAAQVNNPRIEVVQQLRITRVDELITMYNNAIAGGHEGLICRTPHGMYKHGRSTLNQALSLKLKPAKHAEAIITGIEPLVDQAGKVHEMLGKFNVTLDIGGKLALFNIGTGEGLTHARRREFWEKRKELVGLSLSFQYYELSKYGVPRSPSWRGIRYE